VKRTSLPARVEHWRRILVPEWRITLMSEPAPDTDEDDFLAQIQCDDDYHHARLYFPDRSLDRPVGEIDVTIVHELLHTLTRDIRGALDLVTGRIHTDLSSAVYRVQAHAEEQLIERLARVIAQREHPDGLVYGVSE
jgi:hypothetical protein